MFEALKAKLAEAEATVKGAIAPVRAAVTTVEGEVRTFDQGALVPLDKVAAVAGQAKGEVTALIAPLKARAADLKPPGG